MMCRAIYGHGMAVSNRTVWYWQVWQWLVSDILYTRMEGGKWYTLADSTRYRPSDSRWSLAQPRAKNAGCPCVLHDNYQLLSVRFVQLTICWTSTMHGCASRMTTTLMIGRHSFDHVFFTYIVYLWLYRSFSLIVFLRSIFIHFYIHVCHLLLRNFQQIHVRYLAVPTVLAVCIQSIHVFCTATAIHAQCIPRVAIYMHMYTGQ